MFSIAKCQLPDNALLKVYQDSDAYTDCYCTELASDVSHAQYIKAFYTTPIFKLERFILKIAVAMPSSDQQIVELANGTTNEFAVWTVENKAHNQLLLCDYKKRTRSWLMVEQVESANGLKTRLYFGSAVVPIKRSDSGGGSFGVVFHALSWFHHLYSVVLLRSAKSRLVKLGG